MRIWTRAVLVAISSASLSPHGALAQGVAPNIGRPIIMTNRMVRPNLVNPLNSQTVAPNLAASNMTPAIGQQGITPAVNPQSINPAIGQQDISPAMPNPGAPAIVQTQGFSSRLGRPAVGIGQQTLGIGQQGSGTAIGQQGSGTAIGQQGVGTAILPGSPALSPGSNAIVIGQPEPFVPAPAITPPSGFSSNVQNRFGQRLTPTNSMNRGAPPAVLPSGRTLTPTGRR